MDPAVVDQPALSVLRGDWIDAAEKHAIVRLCEEALADDFGRLFVRRPGSVHVLAHLGEHLVGHACWVPRRLSVGTALDLKAAWIEAVAVRPAQQRRGVGHAVMRRLAGEIRGFDVGALTAAVVPFYERLGWERWRGPTIVDLGDGGQSAHEPLMILRLPHTPRIPPEAPLTVGPRHSS